LNSFSVSDANDLEETAAPSAGLQRNNA